jgi:uncharacterized protein YjbJ (UPF0337 family)
MRSARNDKARGRVDTIVGRALDAFGKLTGSKSTQAKGKAARTRGSGRSLTGRAKSRKR